MKEKFRVDQARYTRVRLSFGCGDKRRRLEFEHALKRSNGFEKA